MIAKHISTMIYGNNCDFEFCIKQMNGWDLNQIILKYYKLHWKLEKFTVKNIRLGNIEKIFLLYHKFLLETIQDGLVSLDENKKNS